MKTKSTEQFIQEAKLLHPEYDYSLVEYKNAKTKVKIICPVHKEFRIKPNDFLMGHSCKQCGVERRAEKRAKSTEQFIQEAKLIHPEYDYSLAEYKNVETKVKILCPKHGLFEINPSDLLNNKGCKQCGVERRAEKQSKPQKQFIQEAKLLHPEYDYSLVEYKNTKMKVKILCPKHGLFEIKPNNLLIGQGCPKCASSKGESSIRKILLENSIKFKEQYRIKNCRKKLPLPFDFAVLNENNSVVCLIEFQGIQHFTPIKHFGGIRKFSTQQENDKIKRDYCNKNNLPLIEVRYCDNVEEKIKEILQVKI